MASFWVTTCSKPQPAPDKMEKRDSSLLLISKLACKVYLDDQFLGLFSPQQKKEFKFAAGQHRLKAVDVDDQVLLWKTIILTGGERTTVTITSVSGRPERKVAPGKEALIIIPDMDCHLLINGEIIGPVSARRARHVPTPPGTHRITVRDNLEQNSFLWEKTVTLEIESELIVETKLQQVIGEQQNKLDLALIRTAAQSNDPAKILDLLNRGADINAVDQTGRTPLLHAVINENAPIVRLLLKHEADVEKRYGSVRYTVLMVARNTDILKALLNAGADPNAKVSGKSDDEFLSQGQTALMYHIKDNNLTNVKILLKAGADPNATFRGGETTLMMAARAGNLEIVNTLLEAGVDLKAKKIGLAQFKYATRGETALMAAIWSNNSAVVKALLKAGADPNASGESGTVLRRAIYMCSQGGINYDVLRLLLDAGASVSVRDNYGHTVWTDVLAFCENKKQIIQFLLDYGVSVVAAAPIVFWAAENGDQKLVRILLEKDCDVLNKYGMWARQEARKRGYTEIDQMLRYYGANK
ncbi:ankyrin repeat domain-containing protein [candidate division CSSED10-310 bacterium]|uniref:Ankyrin repeat domain-containing protein n=1 Tax=candidate division CSSED10-310 bacterium TaxID=2855610 RepID=A0ABV6YW27_UNCC1